MASPQKYAEYQWLRDSAAVGNRLRARHVVIWKNKRAMPRAWLVNEAESVGEEEALKRIRVKASIPSIRGEPRCSKSPLKQCPLWVQVHRPGDVRHGLAFTNRTVC